MGRLKGIIQECERLIDGPESVRNIAIAAHIDHGNGITGDARALGNGSISTAKELFERIRTIGEKTDEIGVPFDGRLVTEGTPEGVRSLAETDEDATGKGGIEKATADR